MFLGMGRNKCTVLVNQLQCLEVRKDKCVCVCVCVCDSVNLRRRSI